MDGKSCRLCSTSSTDSDLNIFSERGIEMEMIDILSEHFKCDISEADPLPNVVCEECWQTTETFHILYKKSKEVQEKFLKTFVKSEPDPIDIEFPNSIVECIPIVEIIDSIKSERNAGNAIKSDNGPLIDNVDESGSEGFDDDNNEEAAADENNLEFDTEYKTKKPKRKHRLTEKRKSSEAKKKDEDYQKIFNEYRHLFDMTCDCCPKVFESLEEARKHYSIKHNNRRGYIKSSSGNKLFFPCHITQYVDRHLNPDKFKCTECDRTFCTKQVLVQHMEGHQKVESKPKEKNFQCEICMKTFTKMKNLQLHKKVHNNDPPDREMYDQFIVDNFDMSCDQCDVKFTAFHEARQHYKDQHNEDNGYLKCCGKKLRKLWIIRDHINTHLFSESIKCELCDKTFTTRKLMTKHKFRHKTFICDYCGKIFNNKETIKNHLFTNHVSSEPKFECEICHKKFQLQSLLKNHHYAVHREKKASVTCEICGKSFYAKFFLNKHMVTAHTDKSVRLAMRKQCEHCGEWLLSKSGIYYHKQLHTSGIQKCDQCGMELPNRPALMGHIREHHRVHKHKCDYCGKTFVNAYKLRTHEESHTRSKIYQCKFCPKIFTVSSSRQTHTQRNHKEELELSKQIKNLT